MSWIIKLEIWCTFKMQHVKFDREKWTVLFFPTPIIDVEWMLGFLTIWYYKQNNSDDKGCGWVQTNSLVWKCRTGSRGHRNCFFLLLSLFIESQRGIRRCGCALKLSRRDVRRYSDLRLFFIGIYLTYWTISKRRERTMNRSESLCQ